jgi:PilZ domain
LTLPAPGIESFHLRCQMAVNTAHGAIANAMDERWARLRSHKRIISRVKLLVEWEDGADRQSANAVTVDVSHSGCMAVVGADIPLRKRVRLIHPETGRKAEAQVVWRDHEAWDVGLELEKPDASFWGLKL